MRAKTDRLLESNESPAFSQELRVKQQYEIGVISAPEIATGCLTVLRNFG